MRIITGYCSYHAACRAIFTSLHDPQLPSDDIWWPMMTSDDRVCFPGPGTLHFPVSAQVSSVISATRVQRWRLLWRLDCSQLDPGLYPTNSSGNRLYIILFCDLCFTLLSQNWLMLSGHTWYKREVFITKDHWKVIGEKRSLKPWILFLRDLRDDFQIKKRHIQWHCHYCLRPPPSLG